MAALAAIGAGVAAVSQYTQGKKAREQLDRQAGLSRASSQRQAIDDRSRANLLRSRALALAAASGGGADDPTVSKILSDITARGESNALGSLYEGTEIGAGLEAEGRARRNEGTAGAFGTLLSAAGRYDDGSAPRKPRATSTVLNYGGGMMDKYG